MRATIATGRTKTNENSPLPPRPGSLPTVAAPVPIFRRVLGLGLGLLLAAAPGHGAESPFLGPQRAGTLTFPPSNETSGLAASRRNPGLLWLNDDSGNKPLLYAVNPNGTARGTLQIGGGVKNEDWEDLAIAELDGQPWLVIGDIGDNDAKRKSLRIHFVEEPTAERLAIAGMLAASPAATLKLQFEDGPRDCESLAVDVRARLLYLLTKRDAPPRLYRVALPSPLRSGDVVAHFVGTVPHLPQPNVLQALRSGHLGKRRGEPCAMDFTADGSAAVVLTYGDLLLFPRRDGESWADAIGREPVRLPAHDLPQAEAVCFSPDGRQIFVASERSRLLLRYDRR
jgi:hypothetical protein